MSRAGRAGAAAAVLLALAQLTACSGVAAPAGPRTPRPPASVQASWPGCAAVGAFPTADAETMAGPPARGGVPHGFEPATVVLCQTGERQNVRGDTVSVELERTSSETAALLTYLAQDDEPLTDGACPAIAIGAPWLFLLDASGRYVAPQEPLDACGLPLGWSDERQVLDTLPFTDEVVGERGVQESAEVKRAGCSTGWKDLVDDEATSSHVRPGTFSGDPFDGAGLRVCVYEVPAADRGADAAAGDFRSGGVLAEADRAGVVQALRAADETAARCDLPNARFATVAPVDGGPLVYVELDGCRRVVSDADETPVVRASDELVALLGG